MNAEILDFFKAVAEGRPAIVNWHEWRKEHEVELQNEFKRTRFLRLKLHPLAEIREVLAEAGVSYVPSDEYAWLDGLPGRCRFCGAQSVDSGGGGSYCPEGCYRLMT